MTARTKKEMDEWVRVFRIILTMNEKNVSTMDENPYEFDKRQDPGKQSFDTDDLKDSRALFEGLPEKL